jgi:tetratricopeptide (TPR) repeat protein
MPLGVWNSLNAVGNVYHAREEWAKALSFYAEGLKVLKGLGGGQPLAVCLGNIGEVLYELRRDQEAERNLKEAVAVATKMADRARTMEFSAFLAAIRARRGEREEGVGELSKALTEIDKTGDMDLRVRIRSLLGRVLTEAGDFKAAKGVFEEGLALARATGLKRHAEKIEKVLSSKELEKSQDAGNQKRVR